MLIDWSTVIFQIINFLILMVLLKVFLYDRVLAAMDARQQRVQDRLEEADQQRETARREAEEYRDKKQSLDRRRQEMLDEAKEKAEAKRRELMDQAQAEVDRQKERWRQSLRRQRKSFISALKEMAAAEVFAASRQSLKDLADESLEERVAESFLQRLKKMPKQDRRDMAAAAAESDGPVKVRSAFELSKTLRQKITRAVHEYLDGEVELDYQTEPDMIFGLELMAEGRKMAWSLDEYLTRMEERARAAIEEQTGEREEAA